MTNRSIYAKQEEAGGSRHDGGPSKILAMLSSLADQSGHRSVFFELMVRLQAPEIFAKAS